MRQKDFWIEAKGHPISDLYRFVQDCTELMVHYRITLNYSNSDLYTVLEVGLLEPRMTLVMVNVKNKKAK